jgi:hypothetical protein
MVELIEEAQQLREAMTYVTRQQRHGSVAGPTFVQGRVSIVGADGAAETSTIRVPIASGATREQMHATVLSHVQHASGIALELLGPHGGGTSSAPGLGDSGLQAILDRLFDAADGAPPRPAPQHVVDALPRCVVPAAGAGAAWDACSVCLDDVVAGEERITLRCTHRFHAECVLRWLDDHDSCPACRQAVAA